MLFSPSGSAALNYPRWFGVEKALPVFEYGNGMELWVLPFDLENDYLMGASSACIPPCCASLGRTSVCASK